MAKRDRKFLDFEIEELINDEDGAEKPTPKRARKSKKEKKRKRLKKIEQIEENPQPVKSEKVKEKDLSEWKREFAKNFKLNKKAV